MKVGIMPMGGIADRWRPLAVLKELLPFGEGPDGRPRAAVDYVLDAMASAGVDRIVVPILPEKAEVVMRHVRSRQWAGPPIAYVAAPGPSLLANLVACAPLLGDDAVAFGMPDTYFLPQDILSRCLGRLAGETELALGVFESDDPDELDVVEYGSGWVRAVHPKPRVTRAAAGPVWGVAAWDARFTQRIREWPDASSDPLGAVFKASVGDRVRACAAVTGERFVDLGSSARYRLALQDIAPTAGTAMPRGLPADVP